MSTTAGRIILLLLLSVRIDCDSPLGMEDKRIPDSAIKASTSFGPGEPATNARLGHKAGVWLTRDLDLGEWIQVDLGEITMVTKIATQASYGGFQWVTEYKVSYSFDGGYFKFHRQATNDSFDQVFQGNRDNNSTVINILDPPIVARFIRLHPVKFHGWISLRMELYGCNSGFPTPKPPVCEAGLGLESYAIADKFLTASSRFWSDSLSNAGSGRLHLFAKPPEIDGGWVANHKDRYGSWFQVEFYRGWTKVTRISTQGRQNDDDWVTKYRVSYGYNGIFFMDYQENGEDAKVC
ncbi:hypothetical protein OS493_031485 [Desmophyllum pertusum]|uniref:F5/8 type C domain-containing protein n=1 Tax=Desmophyllum pertusum TaxID=174260 RepID=A0A9W9ZJN7_9CNID|nr:hypothetical protein OS493_031485 [Desmophyllum pertusum]